MYSISEETLNKILNILAALPYSQVSNLIQEIQQKVTRLEQEDKKKKEENSDGTN